MKRGWFLILGILLIVFMVGCVNAEYISFRGGNGNIQSLKFDRGYPDISSMKIQLEFGYGGYPGLIPQSLYISSDNFLYIKGTSQTESNGLQYIPTIYFSGAEDISTELVYNNSKFYGSTNGVIIKKEYSNIERDSIILLLNGILYSGNNKRITYKSKIDMTVKKDGTYSMSNIYITGYYEEISSSTGSQGPPGPQGIQGLKGDAGATGLKGDAGAVGPMGPQGIPGRNGTNGKDGLNGSQGIQGLKGDTGPQGLAGSNASIDLTSINNNISSLNQRVTFLESLQQTINNTILTIQTSITNVLVTLTNHEEKIIELENQTIPSVNNTFPNYFKYLSSTDRKNIICGYAEDNHLTQLTDLGWNCAITYRTLSSGKISASCRCKKI